MSEHIEWSDLSDFPPRLNPEGEFVDGFGNQNDHPALGIYSAVIEGPIGEWQPWALRLFDAAGEYAADEAGQPTPPSLSVALARLAEVMPQIGEAAGSMNCAEVQPIVDVLAAAGYPDAAKELVEAHAESGDDDPGDEHHDLWHSLSGGYHPVEDCECSQPDEYDDAVNRQKEQ